MVLNFGFAKCAPCIKEIPELNSLAKKYADNPNVVFITVTFDDENTSRLFLSQNEFIYNQVVCQKQLVNEMGIVSYPTNMVIDESGKIVFIKVGYIDNIKALLEEHLR